MTGVPGDGETDYKDVTMTLAAPTCPELSVGLAMDQASVSQSSQHRGTFNHQPGS